MFSSDSRSRPAAQGISIRRRWIQWLLVAALLAGVAGWLLHRPLLRGFAQAWVVSSKVGEADAIVMSTGVGNHMFEQCLAWYRAGHAPRLVLMDALLSQTDRAGITEPMRAVRLRQLREAGVPESAVFLVGHELTCLHDELATLRDWARSNGVHHVLLPSDPFATRRVAWLSRRMLEPAGVQVQVAPLMGLDYTVDEWWRKQAGLIAFENEWVLLPCYWARY